MSSPNEQEIEVKFYVRSLAHIEQRLLQLNARLAQARVFEQNLRFDTPDRALEKARRVLRLRRDEQVRLTYKDPALPGQSVSVRREIEFCADNFEAAQHFLEALGYEVSITYEKYRTTYALDGSLVVLDEMPYGNFVEIEGPGAAQIEALAQRLGLDWAARCTDSYLALFNRLRQAHNLTMHNLSFAGFAGLQFNAGDFNLQAAA